MKMTRAQVLDVKPQGGKRFLIAVSGADGMHPEGGGQPGDSGSFSWDGGEGTILNILKKKDEGIVLDVTIKKGEVSRDIVIDLARDDARHETLSRMHSGEHVLSRVMENMKPGLSVYKVAVGEERTSVYFRYKGDIDWDFLFSAETAARSVVRSALPVEALELPIEEAKSLEGLKARWDRVDDAIIRVVRIPGFDIIACSGSHVSNTSMIGEICVESFKGTSPEWELTFSLGDRFGFFSREMRRLVSSLHCAPDEVGKIIERLMDENGLLKKQIARINPYVSLPWEEMDCCGVKLSLSSPVGLTGDLVSGAARRRAEASGGVVLALMDDGESPRIPFILCDPGELIDIKPLLSRPELDARGGGRGGMISGQTGCRSMATWARLCGEEIKGKEKGRV